MLHPSARATRGRPPSTVRARRARSACWPRLWPEQRRAERVRERRQRGDSGARGRRVLHGPDSTAAHRKTSTARRQRPASAPHGAPGRHAHADALAASTSWILAPPLGRRGRVHGHPGAAAANPGQCAAAAASAGTSCVGTTCGCKNAPDCDTSPLGSKCVQGVCGCNAAGRLPRGPGVQLGARCARTLVRGRPHVQRRLLRRGRLQRRRCSTARAANNGNACPSCSRFLPDVRPAGGCTQRVQRSTATGPAATATAAARRGSAGQRRTKTCGASGSACVDCTGNPSRLGVQQQRSAAAARPQRLQGRVGSGPTATWARVAARCPPTAPWVEACARTASAPACLRQSSPCNGACCNAGTCVMACPAAEDVQPRPVQLTSAADRARTGRAGR